MAPLGSLVKSIYSLPRVAIKYEVLYLKRSGFELLDGSDHSQVVQLLRDTCERIGSVRETYEVRLEEGVDAHLSEPAPQPVLMVCRYMYGIEGDLRALLKRNVLGAQQGYQNFVFTSWES
ncbi:hypothetical protein KPC83_00325 [Collinsella sp. zg1085]|uniref:hypothetical protein n=1 Tax=Collinsella sp. zg1085 TaxID=2844380 RepID=UPI001C0D72C0|nr:hypothetical protein [Collinsella sp. zg1085]QWT17656.1 hypothetical protein KPC83_00325 [Collinsella sp. zg1085]